MSESSHVRREPRRYPRVPPFYPVPGLRRHRNGWLPGRQADFLGYLAETGSVSAAAARVGMSRESAYRLRRREGAESFAAAWDAALGLPFRQVTVDDLIFLAYSGLIRPIMRRGRYVRWVQKPDTTAFMRLFARISRRGPWGGD
jgi:hypothetical protein